MEESIAVVAARDGRVAPRCRLPVVALRAVVVVAARDILETRPVRAVVVLPRGVVEVRADWARDVCETFVAVVRGETPTRDFSDVVLVREIVFLVSVRVMELARRSAVLPWATLAKIAIAKISAFLILNNNYINNIKNWKISQGK